METVFTASGLFHEHVHWMQYHSSSLGIFSFMLRQRRAEIIECFLRHLSPERRRAAFDSWEKMGEPLWQVQNDRGSIYDNDPVLCRMSRHWNALLAFDRKFRLGDEQFRPDMDLYDLFKVAFIHSDGNHTLEEIFQSDDPFFDCIAEGTAGQERTDLFPEDLSCRALEECAAFLNQREFYSNAASLWGSEGDLDQKQSEMSSLHDQRMQSYREDPSKLYVSCLDYFFDNNPDFDINDDSVLLSLLIIVDIALNPPLPPFCNLQNRFPVEGGVLFSDADLVQTHPVLRFALLVNAIKSVQMPKDTVAFLMDAPEYRTFVAALCKEAGLMDPHSYLVDNNPIAERTETIWSALDDSPSRYLKSHLLGHHERSVDARRHRPSVFAAPGHNLFYDKDLIPHLDASGMRTLFLNPLQIIEGSGYFDGVSEQEYWRVLAAAGHNLALTSLLSANGSFFSNGLPQDDLHFGMVEKARDSLVKRLRP